MWKRFTLLIFLALLVAPAVAAQTGFTTGLEPVDDEVFPGESATYTLSVTNNFAEEKRFLFSVVALSGWNVNPRALTLAPNETGTATVSVSAPTDPGIRAGQKGFHVTVSTAGDEAEQQQVSGTMTVNRNFSLVVTNLQSERFRYTPGDTVTASATVKNVQDRGSVSDYTVEFLFAGNTYPLSVPTIEAGSTITLDKQIPISNYLVGSHTVTAQLVNQDGQDRHANQITVEVEEVHNLHKSGDEENLLLWEKDEKTLRNQGNVVANETMSLSVPAMLRWLTTANPSPDTTTTRGGDTTYTWNVEGLQPGDTVTVSTRVNYWVIYLFLLSLLILAILVYRYLYAVTVEKHVVEDGTRRAIHIYVKNKTFRDIPQLVVKDHVPGVASLVEDYETRPPDAKRQTEDGTELEWSIDMLHSGEERVYTYRITPRVQVEGGIQLPPATIQYEVHGRELNRLSGKATATFQ